MARQFQYPSVVEPLQARPVPHVEPIYPDRIDRAVLPVAVVASGLFAVFGPPPKPLDPVAPDHIPARALATHQQQHVAGPPEFPVVVSPHLAYPDRLDPRAGLDASQQQALGAPPFPPIVVEGSWAPSYPDRIDPAPGLRVDLQQAVARPVAPVATPVAWGPTYPSQLLPAVLPTAAVQAFAVGRPPRDLILPRVVYPDRIPRRALATYLQQHVADPPEPVAAVEALGFDAVYPDRLDRRGPGAHLQQATFGPVDEPPRDQSFDAVYPDSLPRVGLATHLQQAVATGWDSSVVGRSWTPTYPDRLDPARAVAQYQGRTEPLVPEIVPPVSWYPLTSQPDGIRPRHLAAAQHTAYAAPELPPAPDAPLLAWAPVYPERLDPAPGRPWLAQALAAEPFPEPPVVPLAWAPIYPDAARGSHLGADQQQALAAPPLNDLFPLPPRTWAPVYPDQLRGRFLPVDQQQALAWQRFVEVVIPTVLTACVGDDTRTRACVGASTTSVRLHCDGRTRVVLCESMDRLEEC